MMKTLKFMHEPFSYLLFIFLSLVVPIFSQCNYEAEGFPLFYGTGTQECHGTGSVADGNEIYI